MKSGHSLNLRAERELRGVSLEQISRETRIPVALLSALESDQLDKLPAGPSLKGCLNAYIQVLGLDPEKVYLEFEYLKSQISAPEQDRRASFSSYIPIPVLVFLLTAFVLLIVISRSREQIAQDPASALPEMGKAIETRSPENIERQLKEISDRGLSLDRPDVRHIDSINVAKNTEFEIIAIAMTWIRTTYQTDGRAVLETLLPGVRRVWTIQDELVLEIGDPESVQVMRLTDPAVDVPAPLPSALRFIPSSDSIIMKKDSDVE